MFDLPVLWQIVALLFVHWVADFVLQTHWQASNKSKSNNALLRHIGVYTIVLAAASIVLFRAEGAPFAAINGLLHLITDYFTSRASAKRYAKQEWHNFFVIIGFDQLLHTAALVLTMQLVID